jgi:hypothetical protein
MTEYLDDAEGIDIVAASSAGSIAQLKKSNQTMKFWDSLASA